MDEATLLARFPREVEISAEAVAEQAGRSGRVLIVLDDDPTGTQSVADLPVLTRWETEDFVWALQQDAPAIYVLTNTRSLAPDTAAERNREIVHAATAAAAIVNATPGYPRPLTLGFVSRSDSTLRGHYPLETDVLAEEILAATGTPVDGVVMVPAFPDAGRITIGGTHYMRIDGTPVPVAETEFARDATFGFSHSDLASYVEEKSAGRFRASDVVVLDLGIIRAGAAAIARALSGVTGSTPIAVDIVTENDLRLLSLGLIEAEAAGLNLLYRVGPPLVRARIGQAPRSPLTAGEIFAVAEDAPAIADARNRAPGGLIVVGSHVGLTSRQLARLREDRPEARTIELDVTRVIGSDILDGGATAAEAEAYLAEIIAEVVAGINTGDVIFHTSRLLMKTESPAESLEISRRVSSAVVDVVRGTLAQRPPRFVIAKGGITSSDVAAHGLSIRHAIVRGPMLPGIVSLWESVDGPALGIPYIVFAGNVGDDNSLAEVVSILSSTRNP
ncbi:four-carbon acid sugar kinase family protein [Mycetocola spongiae]|uniref:four-carbon acid sugar kinase family protein n=1 Tax=Mycetocola spongiae TaxID=2859226 RepID=UPI001CF584F6|nr:four-carbon acid sugar kinase family protein [Mycetocola spongiae]UCR89988.1 hypothetical protein KXZ72_04805 [Mycetocola spongiae]